MIKTIVIVEDESIIAMMLQLFLSKLNYRVLGIAKEGQEAIELAKRTKPDLIIMDINIQGDMNGVETYKKINNFRKTAVIFLTGNSMEELRKENIDSDLIIIGKPVSLEDLANAIRKTDKNTSL